jgi:hypothetical protein
MKSHFVKDVAVLFTLSASVLVGAGEPSSGSDEIESLNDGYALALANPTLDPEAPRDPVAVQPAELDHLNTQIVNLARAYDPQAKTLRVSEEERNEPNYVATSASKFVKVFSGEGTLQEKLAALTQQDDAGKGSLTSTFVKKAAYSDVKNIHVCVAGLGGSASHWSNNGYNTVITNGYLNQASFPYHIAAKFNTSVYVGRYLDGQAKLFKIGDAANHDVIHPMVDADFVSYQDVNLQNNDVILYEDVKDNQDKNDIFFAPYEKFNEDIYTRMDGGKFHLYGHSRGGITNLQFVNAHNDWVSKVTSFATPYYSPILTKIHNWVNDWPSNVPTVFQYLKKAFLANTPSQGSYYDLSNEPLLASYRSSYNNLGNDQDKLDAYGYGYTIGYSTKVRIFGWNVEVGYTVEVPYDGMVGTDSGQGFSKGENTIDMGSLGNLLGIPSFSWTSDASNPLNVTRHKILINIAYPIDLYLHKEKRYVCNIPGSDADPGLNYFPLGLHNDEVNYQPIVNSIVSAL